jgi:hypothetical protein
MFQIRDAPATHSGTLSADFAPSSSPKKMTPFPDENISSINRTSDFNGFEGLRVVVWQGVNPTFAQFFTESGTLRGSMASPQLVGNIPLYSRLSK